MLKYFLEQEEAHLDQKIKNHIKRKFIKRRQYKPFHLDCPHTKHKLCYCPSNPISAMDRNNKVALWQNYEKVNNFYQGIKEKEVVQQTKTFQRCRDKIRGLSASQLAEFVRTFRNEKNLHMGENGQFDAV